jgi:hypothetical protein
LEACEFWLAMIEQDDAKNFLIPVMHSLVPVLLTRLQYTEEDIIYLKVTCFRPTQTPHAPPRPSPPARKATNAVCGVMSIAPLVFRRTAGTTRRKRTKPM